MTSRVEDVVQDPEADRFRIEILTWDWNLALSISPDSMPVEYRFQGGLGYSRGLDIWGRVLAPEAHREKTIRIWITSFGPEITFGEDGLNEVGLFYFSPSDLVTDLEALLLLPIDAISPLVSYLGSNAKYLFVKISDADTEPVQISSYFFSSTLPKRSRLE